MTIKVSIGQVKRDISELINRVAYGGEKIILTSRGKDKAAIISMEDFERLQVLREARFAVVREIRESAPDLTEEQVEAEVAEAIKRVRAQNAAGRSWHRA